MSQTIQFRRDLSANWTSLNPEMAQGEIGLETDTGKIKIGDGLTAWNSLAYFVGAALSLASGGTVAGPVTNTYHHWWDLDNFTGSDDARMAAALTAWSSAAGLTGGAGTIRFAARTHTLNSQVLTSYVSSSVAAGLRLL